MTITPCTYGTDYWQLVTMAMGRKKNNKTLDARTSEYIPKTEATLTHKKKCIDDMFKAFYSLWSVNRR